MNAEMVKLSAVTVVTATTTLDASHGIVLVDATAGAVTINLPAASGLSGRGYVIMKIDSSTNGVTIDPNGTELINGSNTKTLLNQFNAVLIVTDGTAWYSIAASGLTGTL